MTQDLPLTYPRMIEKYLQDRINDRKLTSDDNFDEVVFDHNTYIFDVHSNDEMVRITNKVTNHLWNVTKWDCRSDYKDMIELNELLDYIEQNVRFTIYDWINYYTKNGPIYSGSLINIYRDTRGYHIDIISGGAIYIDSANRITITGGVEYIHEMHNDTTRIELDIKETTETGKYTNDTNGVVENLALNLLNAEHALAYVQSPVHNNSSPIALQDGVFELTTCVSLCGLAITIDKENKIVTFDSNGYSYTILKDGTWHNNETVALVTKKSPPNSMIYKTGFYMRYNTNEEKSFARGVIALLNKITA